MFMWNEDTQQLTYKRMYTVTCTCQMYICHCCDHIIIMCVWIFPNCLRVRTVSIHWTMIAIFFRLCVLDFKRFSLLTVNWRWIHTLKTDQPFFCKYLHPVNWPVLTLFYNQHLKEYYWVDDKYTGFFPLFCICFSTFHGYI